jgi:hypothetical protein
LSYSREGVSTINESQFFEILFLTEKMQKKTQKFSTKISENWLQFNVGIVPQEFDTNNYKTIVGKDSFLVFWGCLFNVPV